MSRIPLGDDPVKALIDLFARNEGDAEIIREGMARAAAEHERGEFTKYEHTTPKPVSLDAAWADAEAAMPRDAVFRLGRTGAGPRMYWATAYLHGDVIGTEFGLTPAAALYGLTDQLRGER